MINRINYLDIDVLIIGSGAAGMAAAIAARRKGAKVLILSKAVTGARTATALSDASLTVESPGFTREQHFERTMRSGHFLNDPDLVQALVEEGPKRIRCLAAEMGIEFESLIDQGYKAKGGGMELSSKLLQAAEALGIEKLEKVTLFKLLTHEGGCQGVLGISDSGEGWAIHSTASILAAGGFSGIFPRHDNPKDSVGDGLALALKAGVEVRDMEFVQFLMGVGEESLPCLLIFRPFPDEVRLINESGEDILAKHLSGASLNEAIWSMRDELARALAVENEKGATFLDLTEADWEQADRWFGLRHLRRFRFPFREQLLRVAPIAHYTMGGVAIDRWSSTSLPGLYAAGEVASGVHGANRHGGNSLMDCLVFGYIAGENAAIKPKFAYPRSKNSFRDEFARYKSQKGIAVQDLMAELHEITGGYLGVRRNAAGLERARATLRDLYQRLDQVSISSPRDIKALIELEGSVRVAKMVCEFALGREESRGAHYRKDFPREVTQWQHSQYASCSNRCIRLRNHNRETIVHL